MKNFSKLLTIAILIGGCFTSSAIASVERQAELISPGLQLNGLYDLYVEPLSNSPFLFILPKGEYKVFRTFISNWSNKSFTIETCLDKEDADIRYKMHTGFLLHRKSDSYSNSSIKYFKEQIESFLNDEMLNRKVFFYDQSYRIEDQATAICEGSIFSPTLDSKGATGFYFLKRQVPIYDDKDSTFYACYLLYYSFELDYESAKKEFEKISTYVHCVYNGCAI